MSAAPEMAGNVRATRNARRLTLPPVVRLLPLVAGIVAWYWSLTRTDLADVGQYGLLAIVNPWFFVGMALPLGGFAAELRREDRRTWILVASTVALLAMIHATVPLLSGTPEYSWVYKHIGEAQRLRVQGRITDPGDIYQQWPAFFAGLGALFSVAGVSPYTIARWAPLAFDVANSFLLLGVARLLTRDKRVALLAALLFGCVTTWVGQDYLSPQAFTYLLWLGIVGLVVRFLLAPLPVAGAGAGRILRLRAWLTRGLETPLQPSQRARTAIALLVCAVFAVIVAAHQLTPAVILPGLVCLALLDLIRPRWLVPVLIAISAGFVASRYSIVADQYGGLFSGFDVVQNASGTVKVWHSPGQEFTALLVRALDIGMWLSALAAVAIALRRGLPGRVLLPAILGFTPFVVLFGQSYGGEVIYRVFLFSAPWCSVLIASVMVEVRWAKLRMLAYAVVPTVTLAAGLQGLYGPVAVNSFTQQELTASEWTYAHAPQGATMILGAQNFPALMTADLDKLSVQVLPADPQLGAARDWMDAGDVAQVTAWASTMKKSPAVYLVLSRSMDTYAHYYGLPEKLSHLAPQLARSKAWSVAYRNGDVTVYRLVRGAKA